MFKWVVELSKFDIQYELRIVITSQELLNFMFELNTNNFVQQEFYDPTTKDLA